MISVCMATYNGEAFVREQLLSILSQLSAEDEVLIADDGSTDATLEIIQSLKDPRIQIIPPSPRRLGPVYNLERVLSRAQGKWIFLADQDDVWLPGKVSKVLAEFEKTAADCILHDAFFYRKNQEGTWECGNRIFEIRPPHHGIFSNVKKNSYTGCCMAFRRNLLDKALPFPQSLPMHDQWIGLCAEKTKKARFLREPLIKYRIHLHNATDLANGKRASLGQKILWRWSLVRILLSRLGR